MVAKYRDIISGAFLAVLSVILYISTFSIKKLVDMNIGSDFMPKLCAILLFFLSLGVIYKGFLKLKTFVPEEVSDEEKAKKIKSIKSVSLSIFLILLYASFLQSIGFLITTTLYLFVNFILLFPEDKKITSKDLVLFCIIAVASSAIVYFGFVKGFQLMLPSGILG